ncbi:haloacid dehalogenase [Penicillium macrosclerotiorum]|uniref:haloacid dehalogenase n=1 Tax=Penicillium macrosclerotiorum TaxID=303699 RepID=UPI002549BB57|nr:haloacid dehalogenase [Penicillium macrosclerotiorum]KAJ5688987.1 haloacid dehalogenase [Penicillium macrosclerotiorum]
MSITNKTIKAVFFDFMGTCLDWHSSVVQALPVSIPRDVSSTFALEWRKGYFIENNQRFLQGLEPEDIDITLARVLDVTIAKFPQYKSYIDSNTKSQMIQAWHHQRAWPEVQNAIRDIQEDLGLETFVHANGTTRLQLDLTRSSGLRFNMLFSSQLLGVYKPSPDAYRKALQLVKLEPEEVILVAAHAYDLRGAQGVGMKTIYIHRWTDDIDEDMSKIRTEFDAFLEDMKDLPFAISNMCNYDI